MRTVDVSPTAVEAFKNSLPTQSNLTPQHGLILGQLCNDGKDFVVGFVPTPHDDMQSATLNAKEGDLDVLSEHARQVSSMTPGGISVVGVYVIAPTDRHKDVSLALTAALSQSMRTEGVTECLVVQFCARTLSHSCRSVDHSAKSELRPVDLKASKNTTTIHLYECALRVNFVVNVRLGHSNSLTKQLKSGITHCLDAVLGDTVACTVDGAAVGASLVDGGGKAGGKKGAAVQTHSVHLYTAVHGTTVTPAPAGDGPSASVRYQGILSGRAYAFNGKALVSDAVTALKADLRQSANHRFGRLVEDLADAHDAGEIKENPFAKASEVLGTSSWTFPLARRMWKQYGEGLSVCDYQLPNEHEENSSVRLEEYLSLVNASDAESIFKPEAFTGLVLGASSGGGASSKKVPVAVHGGIPIMEKGNSALAKNTVPLVGAAAAGMAAICWALSTYALGE